MLHTHTSSTNNPSHHASRDLFSFDFHVHIVILCSMVDSPSPRKGSWLIPYIPWWSRNDQLRSHFPSCIKRNGDPQVQSQLLLILTRGFLRHWARTLKRKLKCKLPQETGVYDTTLQVLGIVRFSFRPPIRSRSDQFYGTSVSDLPLHRHPNQ